MTTEDSDWDFMLDIAEKQQQKYYELLPEWTKYKKQEYKYLKQNIGFALFGPPQESRDSNNPEETNFTVENTTSIADVNIIDTFHYKPEAEKILTAIYEKICKYGEGSVEKDSIYYGIIFNVIFRTKNKSVVTSKSKEDSKAQNDDSATSTSKEDSRVQNNDSATSTSKEDSRAQNDDSATSTSKVDSRARNDDSTTSTSKEDSKGARPKIDIQFMPIFKIKRSYKKEKITFYETWYMDVGKRIYKSWTDYKKNNTLPRCTMVLPKDGFYQPNPQYEITEESSKVWLEILNSPASRIISSVLRRVDTASNVIGVVGLGLGIVTMFTPIAPVAMGAFAMSGVNGLWTIGRSTHHLIDKGLHKESLGDKSAFCSWLAITGSAVGMTASGGAFLLTKSVQSGSSVGKGAQVAYNSLLVTNTGINGISIVYQAYCLYEKSSTGEEIHTTDVLFFVTHILFFGNSVMNFQFAEQLIKSTQGKILDDYRASIRSKRLRKGFNRAKRTAAENNLDQISQNAEVIQYINRKNSQLLKVNHSNTVTPSCISFKSGKIMLNGTALLDPLIFVEVLLSQQLNEEHFQGNGSSSLDGNDHTNMFYELRNILLDLLFNYNSQRNNEYTGTFDIDEFDDTFRDMKCMNNAPDIFPLLLEIAIALIKRNKMDFQNLSKAIYFLWSYVKENLRRMCLNLSSSIEDSTIQRKLVAIITAFFDEMDEIVSRLSPAFAKYITEYLRRLFS